ncbi:MAG: aromatic ring-hydroxylating dioxygenase subunit alpha [Planctomycetota bacterium]
MFVHRQRLTHLLRPEHYADPSQHEAEQERLFRPSWQFIATTSQLASPGDFITTELCGTPVLVRNFDGRFVAFVNICPHRHTMLTCQANGHAKELKCQYHGWQFKEDGRASKIPEPKAFRPWDRENAQLVTVRLSRCGDLLFASLDPNGPSLQSWLAPYFDMIEERFGSPNWSRAFNWDFDAACNWKVVIENTLESYHIAEVHPDWMGGQLPAEENATHELTDRYTMLRYSDDGVLQARALSVCRLLGGEPIDGYWHLHLHPNLVFVCNDTLNFVVSTRPTGPQTCHVMMRVFPLWPRTRRPGRLAIRWANWWAAGRLTKKIFNEDRSIYEAQQHGISRSPHRGVIGIREERIFQFQRYVCQQTGLDLQAAANSE